MRTLAPEPRTLATARLRRAICATGLSQERAGQLVGKDGRQVRRWLSGSVALGALELLLALEKIQADDGDKRAARHSGDPTEPVVGLNIRRAA